MADPCRLFTDRMLKSLAPATEGTRAEIWDSRLSGFRLRVSGREDTDPARRGKAGKMVFCCSPGSHPARRRRGARSASMAK